jgi:hypothetical protein
MAQFFTEGNSESSREQAKVGKNHGLPIARITEVKAEAAHGTHKKHERLSFPVSELSFGANWRVYSGQPCPFVSFSN